MDQDTQRATVNDKPRDKCPKLGGSEEVDLEHGYWMGSHVSLKRFIYSQLWELETNSGPKLARVLDLARIVLEMVNMSIAKIKGCVSPCSCEKEAGISGLQAAPSAVVEGINELFVGFTQDSGLGVFEALPILCSLVWERGRVLVAQERRREVVCKQVHGGQGSGASDGNSQDGLVQAINN
jgi:hypothetical protein